MDTLENYGFTECQEIKRIRHHVVGFKFGENGSGTVEVLKKWNTTLHIFASLIYGEGDYSRWNGVVKINFYRGGIVYPQCEGIRKWKQEYQAKPLKFVADLPYDVTGWFEFHVKNGNFVEAKPAKA